MKEQFILNEIWTLTFGAAFQRASVYKKGIADEQKEPLKIDIRSFIEDELESQYVNDEVSEGKHIENIYSLSDYSSNFASILIGGKFNFGVSQKLLNLHLKYMWCLGKVKTPPHFPVDRRIQETLKLKPVVSWTNFDDEKEYLKIINSVKEKLNNEFRNVAEYELNHFKRRVKTTK